MRVEHRGSRAGLRLAADSQQCDRWSPIKKSGRRGVAASKKQRLQHSLCDSLFTSVRASARRPLLACCRGACRPGPGQFVPARRPRSPRGRRSVKRRKSCAGSSGTKNRRPLNARLVQSRRGAGRTRGCPRLAFGDAAPYYYWRRVRQTRTEVRNGLRSQGPSAWGFEGLPRLLDFAGLPRKPR